mmetsp:Transcript_97296/g.297230  ORF Transcript_97296/g.297230 Transcript_97296/m.297230 type:complete len:362 (+) Transcript_97296:439-1524(+)
MGAVIAPDNIPQFVPDCDESVDAVKHSVKPVVHAVVTPLRGLVAVGPNARQMRRYALAVSATALQGNGGPIAWRLGEKPPQPDGKVVLELGIILEDQCHGFLALAGDGMAQSAKMPRRDANGACEAAHALVVRNALRRGDAIGGRDEALDARRPKRAGRRHVHSEHPFRRQAQPPQPGRHPLPAGRCRRQRQHVHGDVLRHPPRREAALGGRRHGASAEDRPLAQAGVQDGAEGELAGIRRPALLGEALLRLPPAPMPLSPQTPLVLHPRPAPVPARERLRSVWAILQILAPLGPLLVEREGARRDPRRRQGGRGVAHLRPRVDERDRDRPLEGVGGHCRHWPPLLRRRVGAPQTHGLHHL